MTPDSLPTDSAQHRNRYRISRCLARSEDCAKYLVRDVASGRPMLMEALTTQASRDPQRRAQFLLEAQISGRADPARVIERKVFHVHHNLCALSEVPLGEQLESMWMPLDLGVVFDLGLDIATGLASLHALGVVHGAIRPEGINVYLANGRARARLLDLGFCVNPQQGCPSRTNSGFSISRDRLAPEIFDGAPLSFLADVYAFGVLCYEMLSGGHWTHESQLPLPKHLPPLLAGLVFGCLEGSPDRRPQSMAQLARAFARLRSVDANRRQPQAKRAISRSAKACEMVTGEFLARTSPSATPPVVLSVEPSAFGDDERWFFSDDIAPTDDQIGPSWEYEREHHWTRKREVPPWLLGAMAFALVPLALFIAYSFLRA